MVLQGNRNKDSKNQNIFELERFFSFDSWNLGFTPVEVNLQISKDKIAILVLQGNVNKDSENPNFFKLERLFWF